MRLFPFIITLTCSTGFAADDTVAPSKMPLAAQTMINHEQDQERAFQNKYEADLAKLHKELATHLKSVESQAIHNEDLEGAEAVKAEIVSLTPKAAAGQTIDYDNLLISHHWIFTWKNPSEFSRTMQFMADGEISDGGNKWQHSWRRTADILTLIDSAGTVNATLKFDESKEMWNFVTATSDIVDMTLAISP